MNVNITIFLHALSLACLLSLTACASKSTSSCDGLPPEEKEACMEEIYKAMEDYKRQRQKETVDNPRY